MGMFLGVEEIEILEIRQRTMVVEFRDVVINDCVVIPKYSECSNSENICRYLYEYIDYDKEYKVYYCDFFM